MRQKSIQLTLTPPEIVVLYFGLKTSRPIMDAYALSVHPDLKPLSDEAADTAKALEDKLAELATPWLKSKKT